MFTENEATFFSFSFLFFFWGGGKRRGSYCFLIKCRPQWYVWPFQVNIVYDTSQNWCWLRAEQTETGNSSVAKISNSSGVQLPMWKIALTVMMLFYLLQRLKLSFTSNASTDALFPSTCQPVLCCLCWWLLMPCAVHVCMYWKSTLRTGPRNLFLKNVHRLLIMQELFSVAIPVQLLLKQLQIIKYRSRFIKLTFTLVYSIMSI